MLALVLALVLPLLPELLSGHPQELSELLWALLPLQQQKVALMDLSAHFEQNAIEVFCSSIHRHSSFFA